MGENKIGQIIQALHFSKNMINDLTIMGVDNIKKILTIHNNLEVFLNMISNNEIEIREKETEIVEEELSQSKIVSEKRIKNKRSDSDV